MPNSRRRSPDVAPAGHRRQPPQERTAADPGFPLGTVPHLPPDAAFFLDIDGTLLDIAEGPQLVRIDDDLGHLLGCSARWGATSAPGCRTAWPTCSMRRSTSRHASTARWWRSSPSKPPTNGACS